MDNNEDAEVSNDQFSSEGSYRPSSKIGSVEWTASEYVRHEKTFMWYFTFLASVALVTTFIFFVLDDVMAAVTVLVVALSLGFFATRSPMSRKYQLSADGLMIDKKTYDLEGFKSFSIVQEGAINSIWLKPLGRISPLLTLYYAPDDEDKIIEVLSNFLPYEQRELDWLDRAMKRLRF